MDVPTQKITIITASSIVYRFKGRPTWHASSLVALPLSFLSFGMVKAWAISWCEKSGRAVNFGATSGAHNSKRSHHNWSHSKNPPPNLGWTK